MSARTRRYFQELRDHAKAPRVAQHRLPPEPLRGPSTVAAMAADLAADPEFRAWRLEDQRAELAAKMSRAFQRRGTDR